MLLYSPSGGVIGNPFFFLLLKIPIKSKELLKSNTLRYIIDVSQAEVGSNRNI